MTLAHYAVKAIDLIESHGHEAYAVGGVVRDMLRGVSADDIDITTSARPDDILKIFSDYQTIPTGLQHGTVTVLIDDHPLEITTYRQDGNYQDHRHPDTVTFTSSLKDDLARRDFTINAIAFHPTRGIFDPFGGQADLENQLLRCVGDPYKRFEEDALRIARLLRFMSVLQFEVHCETKAAAVALCPLINNVAAERKRVELCKLLLGDGILSVATELTQPFLQLVPFLQDTVGFEQHNPHHKFDVFEHTMRAVSYAEKDLIVRLALLFHDIGKPHTFSIDDNGIGHFYSHAAESVNLAENALSLLRFDNHTINAVLPLIRHHGDELIPDKKCLRKRLSKLGEDGVRRLIAVKSADAYACRCEEIADFSAVLFVLEEILAENACFRLSDLAINGRDLIALGYTPGPLIGMILNAALEAVINEVCDNDKNILITYIKERFPQ